MASRILGPRVLLIEKNNHLQKVLESCIVTHNIRLTKIVDLEEEKLQLNLKRYSLLIIDINLALPKNSEIIRKIQENNFLLPIIAIGPNNHEIEIKAYELGINIYHSKPIRCNLLKAQISQLTCFYYNKVILQLKDIQVDLTSQSFLIHNKRVIFTYQEFCLLHLLLRFEGQLLGKDNISKYFFNNHKDVSDAAIDTLVSRIRSKLNKHLDTPFIETKYKLGYRINPVYLKDYQVETNKT